MFFSTIQKSSIMRGNTNNRGKLTPDFPYQPETPSFVEARQKHPDTAFTLTFSLDEGFVWDGDSPEPDTPAFVAEIRAHRIVDGVLKEGVDYLGGYYPMEDTELDFELSGYAPQMIEAALEDLETA